MIDVVIGYVLPVLVLRKGKVVEGFWGWLGGEGGVHGVRVEAELFVGLEGLDGVGGKVYFLEVFVSGGWAFVWGNFSGFLRIRLLTHRKINSSIPSRHFRRICLVLLSSFLTQSRSSEILMRRSNSLKSPLLLYFL